LIDQAVDDAVRVAVTIIVVAAGSSLVVLYDQ
jgi:hypothetical protein